MSVLLTTSVVCCMCLACRPGTYGAECQYQCECPVIQSCHHVTGLCVCPAGYTGTACQLRMTIIIILTPSTINVVIGCFKESIAFFFPFLSAHFPSLFSFLFTIPFLHPFLLEVSFFPLLSFHFLHSSTFSTYK